MGDNKYFGTTKKGEIFEIKAELQSKDKDKRAEAVKKTIAGMTVGKDMSPLFTDVLNCIQDARNVELKKLVYLYLMNYARTNQELAIMAVNTFVKDATIDPSPLVKALAIRTMACIRVDRVVEQLADPLSHALKDNDPYVRKTAALAVIKLFDLNRQMCEDGGFLDGLRALVQDSNPMVISNAVAALCEIQAKSGQRIFEVTTASLNKLLAALNECTEWSQVFIMDALVSYIPADSREAESIVERVVPRMQHKNSAVVLSAVKVLVRCLDHIQNPESVRATCRKMAQPLVTLLHEKPAEIQYVALRNINLVVQKRPAILQSLEYVKMFFCKYYDPIYVKLEKLEILVKLASERNIDQVLLEFKEYAQEVDVDFVRRSVRAIGRCAIKLERATERCFTVLESLIETKVNYVVQEAIIVIKDIFRKYPGQYESKIAKLCENLEELDEPEAKASMIWVIGEYAERIDNAEDLLDSFLSSFLEEPTNVQLAMLTATVKVFLKRPTNTQEMVQRLLKQCTEEIDNPDLRDRGFVYWRLLSHDPESAKVVVLSEKPLIMDNTGEYETTLLDRLVENIGTLSSVYHKPPEMFVTFTRQLDEEDVEHEDYAEREDTTGSGVAAQTDYGYGASGTAGGGDDDDVEPAPSQVAAQPVSSAPAPAAPSGDLMGGDLLGGLGGPSPTTASLDPLAGLGGRGPAPAATTAPAGGRSLLDDLAGLNLGGGAAPAPASGAGASGGILDLMGGLGVGAPAAAPAGPPKTIVLAADKGKGMQVSIGFARRGGQAYMDLTFENKALQPIGQLAMLFNKNSFGLTPAAPITVQQVNPGQSADCSVGIATNGPVQVMNPLMALQVALRNNVDTFYFQENVPLYVLFTEQGRLERAEFLEGWRNVPAERHTSFPIAVSLAPDAAVAKMEARNVFLIARKQEDGKDIGYYSARTTNGIVILAELVVDAGSCTCNVRTMQPPVVQPFGQSIEQILRM